MQLIFRFNLTALNFQNFPVEAYLQTPKRRACKVCQHYFSTIIYPLMVKYLKAQLHSRPEQYTFIQFYNSSTEQNSQYSHGYRWLGQVTKLASLNEFGNLDFKLIAINQVYYYRANNMSKNLTHSYGLHYNGM